MRAIEFAMILAAASCASCSSDEISMGAEIGTVELDPDQMLVRIPPEDINIDARATSVSIGDVDLDGRADIFVASRNPVLMRNMGDAGFEIIPLRAGGSSSAITDMNGDGLPDLVAGWWDGHVQVLYQTEFGFTAGEVTSYADNALVFSITPTPDFNNDDFPDSLHLGLHRWPVKVGLNHFDLNRVQNLLLDVDAQGMQPRVLEGSVETAFGACSDAPTYTSNFIPRQAMGQDSILYTGNDVAGDCLTTIDAATGKMSGMLDGPLTQNKWATMGADFMYRDDGSVMIVSSEHAAVSHMTVIDSDDRVTQLENRIQIEDGANWFEVGWGVIAEPEFILVARGKIVYEDPKDEAIGSFINPAYIEDGGVDLYVPDGENWVQQQSLLPPELEGQRLFHVASGDFYGNDGRGDGCLDFVVTPFLLVSNREDAHPLDLVYGSAEFLVGTCRATKGFLGVGLASIASDIGAMAVAKTSTGKLLRGASKTTSGVNGTADPRIRIPLPEGTAIDSVTIYYANGTQRTLRNPPLNSYLDPKQFVASDGMGE